MYRIHKSGTGTSVGYGYECFTELTEESGTGNTPGKYPGYASVRTLHNTTLDKSVRFF